MGIVLEKEDFIPKVAARANAGQRVIIARGVFDLLHPGHIRFLENARSECDAVAVLLESDASARKSGGNGWPVIPEGERAEILAALGCVDYVVIADDAARTEITKRLGPDVTVKTAPEEIEGGVSGSSAKYSTSALMERVKNIETRAEILPGHLRINIGKNDSFICR